MVATVHDLLGQGLGDAKMWVDRPDTVRWFEASEAPAALERHGYVFTSWPDGRCLLERAVPSATPADLFLRMYSVTGDPKDWVAVADLRGHWLAEHVSLPAKDRDGGVKALLALGCTRGRVKGVGGVLRGVLALRPMELDELRKEFA